MSDQQIGLKMVEREDLEFFLDAYEVPIGERLRRPRSPQYRNLRSDHSPARVHGAIRGSGQDPLGHPPEGGQARVGELGPPRWPPKRWLRRASPTPARPRRGRRWSRT